MTAVAIAPGRVLDEMVADKVMGGENWPMVPFFSTEIGAAWQVVEHFRAQWERRFPDATTPKRARPYWVFTDCNEFGWRVDVILGTDDGDAPEFFVAGETLPHAICLAALRFVGVRMS